MIDVFLRRLQGLQERLAQGAAAAAYGVVPLQFPAWVASMTNSEKL